MIVSLTPVLDSPFNKDDKRLRIGRIVASNPTKLAGDKSVMPIASSALSCAHKFLNSEALEMLSISSSICAQDIHDLEFVGFAFTEHLNNSLANGMLPSLRSKIAHACKPTAASFDSGRTHTPRWNNSLAFSIFPALNSATPHACQFCWCDGSSFVPAAKYCLATRMFPSFASNLANACNKLLSAGFNLTPL